MENETELKTKLLNKLDDFPLLRILVFEFWFRIVFLGFVLILVCLGLALPRMWTVSPPDFQPTVKVRGIELIQAWALKRSALAEMAKGRYEEASYSWSAAISHNPADPALFRGYLTNLQHMLGFSPQAARPIIAQSSWLLRLTHTNAADVKLVARAYEKAQLYDLLVELLRPFESKLDAEEESAYLKGLFQMDHVAEFAARWERAQGRIPPEPELGLYRAAYLAGWGPPETAEEGRSVLLKAENDTTQGLLVTRLQMLIKARAGDVQGYRQYLDRLEKVGRDRLMDHLGFWRLLTASGRKNEARELVQNYPYQPTTSIETLRLAGVYVGLGMDQEAIEFLKRYAPQFGANAEVWLVYSRLLAENRLWEELRRFAVEMRQSPGTRDKLTGYSYYLEGRAELAQDRPLIAESAFQKVPQFAFEDKRLGLRTAIDLIDVGQPGPAQELLLKLENHFVGDPEYWHQVGRSAYLLKQADVMLNASRKAYDLDPNNSVYANNYAAALIIQRALPEEAVKLTLRRLTRDPNSNLAKINHSLALLMGRRTQEAQAILSKIEPTQLRRDEATSYYLALFEAAVTLARYSQAREAAEHIDRQLLFPSQVRWLERAEAEMPPRVAGSF